MKTCKACGRQPPFGTHHCYACRTRVEKFLKTGERPRCKHCSREVGIGWKVCEDCLYDTVTASCAESAVAPAIAAGYAREAVRKERLRHRCSCAGCKQARKGTPHRDDVGGLGLKPDPKVSAETALAQMQKALKFVEKFVPTQPSPTEAESYDDESDDSWAFGAAAAALGEEDGTPRAAHDARWKSKDGGWTLVRAMSNDHLLNTVRLIAPDAKRALPGAQHVGPTRREDHLLQEAFWRGLLTTTRPLRGHFVREPKPWTPTVVDAVMTWLLRVRPEADVSTLLLALDRVRVYDAPRPTQQALTEVEEPPAPLPPFSHARQGKRKITLGDDDA